MYTILSSGTLVPSFSDNSNNQHRAGTSLENGSFQFNRTPLEAAMRQLVRWYNIEVVYEKDIPDIKLSGKMKRDLTLPQVLDGLRELEVKFRVEGKQLIIM